MLQDDPKSARSQLLASIPCQHFMILLSGSLILWAVFSRNVLKGAVCEINPPLCCDGINEMWLCWQNCSNLFLEALHHCASIYLLYLFLKNDFLSVFRQPLPQSLFSNKLLVIAKLLFFMWIHFRSCCLVWLIIYFFPFEGTDVEINTSREVWKFSSSSSFSFLFVYFFFQFDNNLYLFHSSGVDDTLVFYLYFFGMNLDSRSLVLVGLVGSAFLTKVYCMFFLQEG